jgi:hypothetical protein
MLEALMGGSGEADGCSFLFCLLGALAERLESALIAVRGSAVYLGQKATKRSGDYEYFRGRSCSPMIWFGIG